MVDWRTKIAEWTMGKTLGVPNAVIGSVAVGGSLLVIWMVLRK